MDGKEKAPSFYLRAAFSANVEQTTPVANLSAIVSLALQPLKKKGQVCQLGAKHSPIAINQRLIPCLAEGLNLVVTMGGSFCN